MTPISVSDPAAAAASQPPDIQQLVGLLGNLMPVLLRFQLQALEQPFQVVPGSFVVPNSALDRQAAETLIEDIIVESLRTLSAYLEANVGLHAGLESCIPIVTQAAHRYAARDFAQAFNLIWMAYRAIETIRVVDPRIPPARAASSDQTSSSIH